MNYFAYHKPGTDISIHDVGIDEPDAVYCAYMQQLAGTGSAEPRATRKRLARRGYKLVKVKLVVIK